MNGTDIDQNPTSAASFPLPFHILMLVGLGIFGWAMNLHGLDAAGIDVISAMDLRTDGSNPLPAHHTPRQSSNLFTLYRALYRISIAYGLLCLVSWSLYLYATGGDIFLVDAFGYIPGLAALFVLGALFCPYNVLHKTERRKFLHAIRRCLTSPWDSPVYFSDVVLADIFTSFSQVLGDVWLSLCMLIPGNSILVIPFGEGWARWILPTVMCLPYLVRLRQCLIEYNHQGNTCNRPLYNALKYVTAFPVIYLTAAQRIVMGELTKENGGNAIDTQWHGEHRLFRLWLLAAIINSLYSFWWDVTNDWGLTLLQSRPAEETQERPSPPRRLIPPRLHSSSHLLPKDSLDSRNPAGDTSLHTAGLPDQPQSIGVPGLRPTLFFPELVYPIAITLNLLLRLAWSMRLSSLIQSHASVTNFCLKLAELLRRWMWVFIRVEWEMIKKGRENHSKLRTDIDDVDYELIPSATME